MPAPGKTIKLALVDDHKLFRKGMISLINSVGNEFEILFEVDNGIQLKNILSKDNSPDIILMDVNMPFMNGVECVEWLSQNHPLVKVLIVSMIEKEETIVQMLKLGVKGYISKDVEPHELAEALHSIVNKGYYFTDFITGKLVHSLQLENQNGKSNGSVPFTDRELSFLKLACTEMTYNEIASSMYLSPKTIDGYRDALFEKLKVKSRIGLVLYAIKNGIVQV